MARFIIVDCKTCGNSTRIKYERRRETAQYCSVKCRGIGKRIPVEQRFWTHVQKTASCWLWTGSRHVTGYGETNANQRKQTAHRASYEITYGPIPDGLCVLHKCDNPPCVRPDHLFLGTRTDNNADKVMKGRTVSRLTAAQVGDIRNRRSQGVTVKSLAVEHRVHPATIRSIIRRVNWKHLE